MNYAEAVEIAVSTDSTLVPPDVVATDFRIDWDYAPHVPASRHVDGGGTIFVNKKTQEVWGTDAPYYYPDRIEAMTPVGSGRVRLCVFRIRRFLQRRWDNLQQWVRSRCAP